MLCSGIKAPVTMEAYPALKTYEQPLKHNRSPLNAIHQKTTKNIWEIQGSLSNTQATFSQMKSQTAHW